MNYTINITEAASTGYVKVQVVSCINGEIIYLSWHKTKALALDAANSAITRHLRK